MVLTMKVKEILIDGFMGHQNFHLSLPDTGIVVVCGKNGTGKSAIIESIAHCVWGNGVRGRCWNNDGSPSSLAVAANEMEIERTRKAAKSQLFFKKIGEERGVAYETATKAQEALGRHIPPFDIWKKSCVLSSMDSSRFTLATDMERKVFLEDILGLQRINTAYQRAKESLRELKKNREIKEVALERMVVAYKEKISLLDKASLPAVCDGNEGELLDNIKNITLLCDESKDEVRQIETAIIKANREIAAMEKDILHSRKIKGPVDGVCFECGQPVSASLMMDMRRRWERLLLKTEDEKKITTRHLEDLIQNKKDVVARLHAHEKSLERLQGELYKARAESAMHQRMAETRELLVRQVDRDKKEIEKARAEIRIASQSIREVDICCSVLGPQGIRAQLLEETLEAVETSANVWLRYLDASFTLRMFASKETKSKKSCENITLEVCGGGAKDYVSCSGGERRRIDIAVLFALSDVARASYGDTDWTLWCDEVFDALDDDGVHALAQALRRVSLSRLIVVITHQSALAEALGAEMMISL